MRDRRRLLLLAVVAALALLVVTVAAVVRDADEHPPGLLVDALEVMPAEAAGRGLYYTTQTGTFTSVYGFAPGRVEPAVTEAYGIRGEHISAVLESGGPTSTVLLGGFVVDDVAAAFESLGYGRSSQDGWTVLSAGAQAQGPLAAGAEAVALRPGAVVIATSAELARLLAGGSAATSPWVAALVGAVPGEAAAVAMGPSYDEMVGDKVAPPGPEAGPSRYAGWLLAFTGDGSERAGLVALTFSEPVGPAAAGQLAAMIGAAPRVGDAVVLHPEKPQWDARRSLATVAVTATGSPQEWAQLRRWLDAGAADFLRQR